MLQTIRVHALAPDEEAPLPASAFRRVAEMATRLVGVPIAVIRVGDMAAPGSAGYGLEQGRAPASLVARVDPAIVPATDANLRLLGDPVRAAEAYGLAFHAGAPLRVRAGPTVGMLDVFDLEPREFTAAERRTLDDLAAVAAEEIDIWLAAERLRTGRAIGLHEREIHDDISIVLAALRDVAAYEDPAAVRPAICRVASSVTTADAAALYEMSDDDQTMAPTFSVGSPWPWPVGSLGDPAQPVARAYITGKAILDVHAPVAQRRTSARPGSAASFWQPFAAGGPTAAVAIGLAWHRPGSVAPVRVARLMETLAAEAIRVIERADLLTTLGELTRTDELTGLPNRRALNDALPRELERSLREGHGLCLAMLDLDHFKRYNDANGHPAGDRLLAAAAVAWRDALRSGTDLLARYGGEEFAVVLPTTMDAAHETLERMRAATPDRQTVSIGLASWDGLEQTESLIARADAALYRAKAGGRDQIRRAS